MAEIAGKRFGFLFHMDIIAFFALYRAGCPDHASVFARHRDLVAFLMLGGATIKLP